MTGALEEGAGSGADPLDSLPDPYHGAAATSRVPRSASASQPATVSSTQVSVKPGGDEDACLVALPHACRMSAVCETERCFLPWNGGFPARTAWSSFCGRLSA